MTALALNPAQQAAVLHPGGPLLVLAGAGSGKTRVLTARIAHLIRERGVAPDRIYAVTFTNKAAAEMRGRVAALLGADPRGLWIGTFHSLSARLLRREAPRLGFGPNFTIYDADDSESFIKRLLEQRGISPKANPPRAVHSLISAAKNRMLSPEQFAADATGALARAAAEVYGMLGPALKQANAMDFDDLLLFPLKLLEEFPDRLAYWQRRFEYVLVDEFQDTNAAQYQQVRLLAFQHKNLCVVGDDDQAIYGWRGADVRHMLAFQRDFPGTTLVKLEQNYRSTQIILDAANGVIAENRERLGKTLFTDRQGGDPVTLLTAADERDEAQWLAGELARRAAESDVPYTGMAVLYRTNAQSRPLEDAFRYRGIPYRLVGAVSFYERREVKDVLAYLRVIVNPADGEALLRIANVPRRGIGDTSLELLSRASIKWQKSLYETARTADRIPELRPNVRTALQDVITRFDRWREELGSADPATVLERVVKDVGYEAYLADEGPEGIERLDNVAELIAGAAEWAEEVVAADDLSVEGNGEAPPPAASLLERYLTQAALLTPADDAGRRRGRGDSTGDETETGITLMTVHMAKGLEWPVVVLAGLEDGLFPLGRSAEVPGGLEEERRLCYVGLTRAREKLYLSWARTRYRNGRLELAAPSRFLEAVPPHVIEERSTSSRWGGDARTPRFLDRGARDRAPSAAVAPVWEDEDESQDVPRYVTGERVRHRKFGGGVVRGVTGSGRALKVTVEFDDAEIGTKQLLVAYAGLEREWEGG
ncbi:MAG TPA: UvrD-helicase domain-containing protein [Gemmatimonadales bacterium]|nr:UvrD-helicase domain-containing protein [Gemmatimonadales bacterium]